MRLTKKQFDIIDEWFKSGGDETAVLQKYNIPQSRWKKCLADSRFNSAIDDKLKAMQRQSMILIAQYVSMAAAKLIQLCGSDKEETSRKACLDILALQAGECRDARPCVSTDAGDDEEEPLLDAETASKILAVIAEKKEKSAINQLP